MITTHAVDVEERQDADDRVVAPSTSITPVDCTMLATRLRCVSITPFGKAGRAARVGQHDESSRGSMAVDGGRTTF